MQTANKHLLVFITMSFFIVSCSTKEKSDFLILKTRFDTADFSRSFTETDKNGHDTYYYINKYDSNFFMLKRFWPNDSLFYCLYMRRNRHFGPYREYDSTGKLTYEGFYFNSKLQGYSILYDAGKMESNIMYNKGVPLKIDTSAVAKVISMTLGSN